jgi:hypothetical protein
MRKRERIRKLQNRRGSAIEVFVGAKFFTKKESRIERENNALKNQHRKK